MFSAWFSEIFLLCFRQHKPRNHQRAAESPAKWWSEEEKFVNSKSKYGCGGKMGNKKSFRFIPTGGYYEYFNIWLTLTCQSKDSSNVSFMTNGSGIRNLFSIYLHDIARSAKGEAGEPLPSTRTYFSIYFSQNFPVLGEPLSLVQIISVLKFLTDN